ncbi:hypothetical protein GF351_02305 [Candidatus Woesearchaeota archaeon]|nr:hypothetical protein [Candidatus Woesearchaeota archaeon]
MKKRAWLVSITIFLVFVLISGCTTDGGADSDYVGREYHRGTQGIETDFVRNAPPSTVYEGDSLEVIVELRNRGAWPTSDILEGKLEVSGFDLNAIRGTWQGGNQMPNDLQGRSMYNPEGGYDTMTYRDSDGVRVPFEADKYEANILVHSCYRYKTMASPIVCIDPDPYRVVQEEKVCDIEDSISVGSGQGGPVGISSIREKVGSENIYFEIYIRNFDNGRVAHWNAYNRCPFDLEYDEINKVIVDVKLPYDSNPDCSPAGTASDPVRLVNGQGWMHCSFNKPMSGSAFTTPLQIELRYIYSDTIEKEVEIIRITG